MAGSLNKVTIIGNLGRDPEIRNTNDGKAIATLNIATSESWKDKATGERNERSEWHRVVIFGAVADVAQKYLKKGSSVYIEGKLQTRKWTDAQGVEKYTTEIVVDGFSGQMTMLGGKADNDNYGSHAAPVAKAETQEPPFSDEIPFS